MTDLVSALRAAKINQLKLDSRQINPGDAFFAVKGALVDGHNYIGKAIEQGAQLVVAETLHPDLSAATVPYIIQPNLSQKLSAIAGEFYGQPSRALKVVGVTGTNGKSSTCHMIAELLQQQQLACGYLGTLGMGFIGNMTPVGLTTPDPLATQRFLAKMKADGAAACAMEVSSHALVQDRVRDICFDCAVFTNLSHDHLDYHGDMQSYWQAKQRLFRDFSLQSAVINCSDPHGQELIQQKYLRTTHLIGYGFVNAEFPKFVRQLRAQLVDYTPNGCVLDIDGDFGQQQILCPFYGDFNSLNCLAAIGVALAQGFTLAEICHSLSAMSTIPGRMQQMGGKDEQPLVIIDYAHTPDALEKTLQAIGKHHNGKVWTIVGCGGDRDRGKRPIMAEMAELYSNHLIFTQDNPRHEDPMQIIEDMKLGLKQKSHVTVILDRATAITETILKADKNDVILIAGKGHESYQVIGDQLLPYHDEQPVKEAFSRRLACLG